MNYLHCTLVAGLINAILFIGVVQTESRTRTEAQTQVLQASSLIWRNLCGVKKQGQGKQATLYCLNSPKLKGHPVSEDIKSLVAKWLVKHPNAIVLPVYSSPIFLNDPSSPIQIYAWVVDGDNNLNVYLVRMGACPSEMMKLESGDKPMISEGKYEDFVKRIDEAERDAKTQRLGIWRNQGPR